MTIQFDTVPFSVYVTGDAQLPDMTPDENGYDWYDATIRFSSRSDFDDMNALLCGIDIIPAMSMRGGGIVSRRWGPGSQMLTYPRHEGTEITRRAILVSLSPLIEILRDELQVEARWLMLGSS